ncbi:radial spoke head protein 3 homolog B isoform X2 [Venturia canescens]|uniref:radial spoke head protein 3 homolog B isoform X2 n=1 Tax=Venturia canescens TaxID=32260 RepID=UPI001C9CB591|nr:radial spoke head protein 3 homolog B isoform X2 [Venturia canescens]
MPAGISNLAPPPEIKSTLSHEVIKNPPAFTIVHKDGHTMTLPLLHMSHVNGDSVNEDEMCKKSPSKPDSRSSEMKSRASDYSRRKRMSRSNDHLILADLQNHQANPLRKKQQSKSHESLGDGAEKKRARDEILNNNIGNNRQTPMSLSTEDFNEVLNAKLRKLQERDDERLAGRRGCKKSMESQKKPFITTVKTGEFLMPPPEVAALLGMSPNGTWIGGFGDQSNENPDTDIGAFPRSRFRRLISLGRKPEVRHNSHKARCPAALKATVDFAANFVNATSTNYNNNIINNSIVSSTNGLSCPQYEKARRANRFLNSEIDQPLPFGNIMFDRRVVRGSTYASAPTLIDADQSQAARQSEAKRKQMVKKRAQSQAARLMMMRIGTPPPVPGRKHEPVQTELYLEELYDRPEESEVATQTDYLLDRPPTPVFCPGKVGQDAETQIDPGDLFDYDVEVQPILEVLVGKTIEQALIEVLEEEELAALKEQQRRFRELRAAEKAEQQRLEEQERRLREEKCRRVRQHEEAVKTQKETEERVAAAVLLTGYIAELLPAVLEGLKMSGFLLDEIKADVEEGFMPWLMKEVKKEMGSVIESRELLAEIIREILENRAQTYTRLGEDYDQARDTVTVKSDDKPSSESETAIPTDEGGEGREVDSINYEEAPVDDADETNAL